MKKQLIFSIISITVLMLISFFTLLPEQTQAYDVVDGDLIRNPNAVGMAQFDIYIVKINGDKKFKRLILSPHVFESYEHFDKNDNGNNWDDVIDVSQVTLDLFITSDLVRPGGQDKVYRLYAIEGTDTGAKFWLNMATETFNRAFDSDSIYTINNTDTAGYKVVPSITDPDADFPPTYEFPLNYDKMHREDNREKSLYIYVENPFDYPVNIKLEQPIPGNASVLDYSENGKESDSVIVWDYSMRNREELFFSVDFKFNDDNTIIPAPKLTIYSAQFDEPLEFTLPEI